MRDRGLKAYRTGLNLTDDAITHPGNSRDFLPEMLSYAKTYGITLQPIIFSKFHWIDDMTKPRSPSVNRTQLYDDAYNRTKAYVRVYANQIKDWEMGNEINLRMRYDDPGALVPPRSYLASSFDTERMNDWAAVLKGQSDAIKDLNNEGDYKLRRVLNTTGLDFGFLKFMQSKNVEFDVISYHHYEKKGTDMTKFWNGAGPKVNLFKLLAEFGKPIIINETNCNEIYRVDTYDANGVLVSKGYENKSGGNLTQDCMESFDSILTAIAAQKDANIEGVLAHTFVDIPYKDPADTTKDQTGYFPANWPVAETRFGMMYDLDNPKLSMAILAYHAGGLVTPAEKAELIRLGLIRP